MRLGAVQTFLRIFRIFLEFIIIFPKLILFIRRLKNIFHDLQIFYLDCSCLNLSLGIFLKVWNFPSIFRAFKTILDFLELFLH
jgi:hypothetical protein